MIDLKEKAGGATPTEVHVTAPTHHNAFLATMRNQPIQKQFKICSVLHIGSLLKCPLFRICKHGNLSNVATAKFYELCLLAGLTNLLS